MGWFWAGASTTRVPESSGAVRSARANAVSATSAVSCRFVSGTLGCWELVSGWMSLWAIQPSVSAGGWGPLA